MTTIRPLTWKEAKARAQQRGCSGICVCRECCLDEAAQSLGPVPAERPRQAGSRPVAQTPAKRRPRGWREASEKQVALIGRLFNEREWDSPLIAQTLALETYEDGFGGKEASALIDLLLKLPRVGTRARKAQQEATSQRLDEELEEGALYALGEGDAAEIYRVQRSKTSGKLYALRVLEEGGTEYAPGIVTRLDPQRKLRLDEAQAWGRKTGTCCNCYAKLTDPKSVERGLGPVCAKRI
mgnify:CR=1 FL=1